MLSDYNENTYAFCALRFFRFSISLRYQFCMIFPPALHLRIKGTSINCRERPEDKADGTQKPECTQST